MVLIVFLFALIGLWFRGGSGFFVGGAIGLVFFYVARGAARRRLAGVQDQFIEATFAVMGSLCKADGVVSPDEIRVVEQIFGRLDLSSSQKQAAKAAFNRGKSPDFDLDGAVDTFMQATPRGVLFPLFLQLQLLAVSADGQVHPAEHAMLVRVARRLGLTERDLARLEALLGSAAVSTPDTSQRLLDAAYAALGVTADASEADIKRAYRKMIRENHPDRLAANGLPEAMRAIAEERAREINAAFDRIKKARQFT